MSSRQEKFAQLKVISPCEASWEEMDGNHQKRHCGSCNKHVFDFAHMAPKQVEAMVSAKKGNLCARITRDANGTLVTLPDAPVVESVALSARRRGSPFAGAMVSALLSLSVPTAAILPVMSPMTVDA